MNHRIILSETEPDVIWLDDLPEPVYIPETRERFYSVAPNSTELTASEVSE